MAATSQVPGSHAAVGVIDPKSLTDRYVALWNEPDADRRRSMIRELWAPTGQHVLDPPEELRTTANALGFAAPTLELRGHAALEARVARAHDEFVAPGKHFFRSRGNAAVLRNLVKFNWEMVSTATGEVAGVGLDVFEVDDRGFITCDYQFVEP